MTFVYSSDDGMSRRRLLRALGALVAGSSLIAACGPGSSSPAAAPTTPPAAPPTTASAAKPTTAPAAQPTTAAAAKPTTAPAAAPAQATPGGIGNKPISIEWWRRNYTPGSQNAETVTSDAAVKAFGDRYPNVTSPSLRRSA